ncbi:catalase family protein [Novosphingobium sp. P6W]|uniref:catalase family protein n=1 Tax=Novosphingobium sp. P6W TaxID=1609758 RepID=UPI000697E03D|nr:catalase family protein [Novosphingobium sp. P6W]AXB75977.1 catalase [Novosphingobium sp. P6W]
MTYSAAPVRYSSSVESLAPDEEETVAKLKDAVDEIQHTMDEHHGARLRGAHAKGQALLKARLTVIDNLPPSLAQGLFASAGSYDAIMRFSTAPGDILDDSVSGPRGLALKILEVEGERLPDTSSADGQDFLMVNGPIFPNATPAKFLPGFKGLAKTTDKAPGLKKLVSATLQTIEAGLESVGMPSPLVQTLGGAPNTQPLGDIFFTQVASRYGDYIAKLSLAPVSPHLTALAGTKVDAKDRPDALREDINAVIQREGGVWELRVQLCTDLEKMPVEDPTVEWDQDDSPFIAVARIEVAPQESWDDRASADLQAQLAFSPWHGLAAFQPLGGISRARKSVYEHSQAFRGATNACPMHASISDAHPTSASGALQPE